MKRPHRDDIPVIHGLPERDNFFASLLNPPPPSGASLAIAGLTVLGFILVCGIAVFASLWGQPG
jgi:hypothetical protein